MRYFFSTYIPTSFWFTCGTLLGISYRHTNSYIPLILGIGIVFYHYLKKEIRTSTLISTFFFIGILSYNYKIKPISPFKNISNVYLEAKILDKSFLENKFSRFKMIIFVERFYYHEQWFSGGFLLAVYSQKRNYSWVDDTIICGPVDIKNSEHRDFKNYLQKEGLGGSIFCEELPYQQLERPSFSWNNWIFWQRELLQIKLFKKMSPKTFSLFSSLFMGNKNAVSSKLDQYKNDFKLWGISHYLARSGLHLIIFILIWNFLFNFLPLPFKLKHLIILLLTLCYVVFSWSSVSFMRAISIYILYKIGVLFSYRSQSLHILSIICNIFLIYNPLYLFALDFQLSFLLSFCLVWISEIMHQKKLA